MKKSAKKQQTVQKRQFSIPVFILRQLIWGVLLWMAYQAWVYREIPGLTSDQSVLLLAGSVIGCSLIGFLCEVRKHRNDLSIFINLGLGFGIYYILSSWKTSWKILLISLAIFLLVFVTASTVILIRRKKKRMESEPDSTKSDKLKRKERRDKSLPVVFLTCLCLSVFTSMGCDVYRQKSVSITSRIQNLQAPGEDQRIAAIEENLGSLAIFHNAWWYSYTHEEKLKALQIAADIEKEHLGLPHDLTVEIRESKWPDAEISYHPDEHTIAISDYCLQTEEGYECLKMLCREAYISYEYALIDALDRVDDNTRTLRPFRAAEQYRKELIEQSEETENKNREELLSKKDAEDYASKESKVYLDRINQKMRGY